MDFHRRLRFRLPPPRTRLLGRPSSRRQRRLMLQNKSATNTKAYVLLVGATTLMYQYFQHAINVSVDRLSLFFTVCINNHLRISLGCSHFMTVNHVDHLPSVTPASSPRTSSSLDVSSRMQPVRPLPSETFSSSRSRSCMDEIFLTPPPRSRAALRSALKSAIADREDRLLLTTSGDSHT